MDFEDPSFTSNLWAINFYNLFQIYNALEELNYGQASFNPTLGEVSELYNKVFTSYLLHSVENNLEYWIGELIFNNFPTFGSFEPQSELVTDWVAEKQAVAGVLTTLANVLGENKEINTLSVDDFRGFNNYQEANSLFTSLSNSVAMRSLLVAVLDEAIKASSSSSAMINVQELLVAEATAQITPAGYVYNEAFWTPSTITELAKFVVLANAIFFDEFGNFNVNAFDFTDVNNFGEYNNDVFASNGEIDPAYNVGVGTFLVFISDSSVFSADVIGGSTGLIATELSSLIGDVTSIKEIENKTHMVEILDAIKAISDATAGNLNAYGINVVYANLDEPETVSMFEAVQDSEVLAGIIPSLMNQIIGIAASDKGVSTGLIYTIIGSIDADIATGLMNPNSPEGQALAQVNAQDLIDVLVTVKAL